MVTNNELLSELREIRQQLSQLTESIAGNPHQKGRWVSITEAAKLSEGRYTRAMLTKIIDRAKNNADSPLIENRHYRINPSRRAGHIFREIHYPDFFEAIS